MSAKTIHRVQDSIHGLMEFERTEAVVIDLLRTPELQRLRKIRQLGLAHLVFPGAEHSRLVHSLGAAHLAVRFGKHLATVARRFFVPEIRPDESSIRELAVAALCHDLGHGPLSHAWEREIVGEAFDRMKWAEVLGVDLPEDEIRRKKWHELVGASLLNWEDGQLHRLLEQIEPGSSKRITGLLSGQYYLPYWPRILNSDVDVDRADFIARDTHQTGVAYGKYDLNWLISTGTFGSYQLGDRTTWVIGFDARKAVRVVEQFLIARRALYDTVYHHKAVRCAEGMMSLFLRRLRHIIQAGMKIQVPDFVRPMIDIMNGMVIGPAELLRLDDFSIHMLVDLIADSQIKDETVRDLAERIRARDLFKQVPLPSRVIQEFLMRPHAHDEILADIKQYCPGDPEFYLLTDHVQFQMMSSRPEEAVCFVDEKGGVTFSYDHPAFDGFRRESRNDVRLFTLQQAVPPWFSAFKTG